MEKDATVAKNATVQKEGGQQITRKIEYFNLDAIISVVYRANSKRGTQFHIWATTVLRDHLVRGYTLNQRRLAEKGVHETQQVLALLTNTLDRQNLVNDEGRSVLDIVSRYVKTWQLLLQYDENVIPPPSTGQAAGKGLGIKDARTTISSPKQELMKKGEATGLFGSERNEALERIIGAVHQTFGGNDLYPSIEEKAANFPYFVIKDHTFTDE